MLSSANSFYVIIFALVVSLFQIDLNASFIEGTLVKTPQGLIPVESLKVGDNVISCELNADAKEEFCKPVAVKEIITHVVSTMVCIHIDNGLVYASSDQLFFDSIANQWLAAQLLTENSVFINSKLECFNCVKIESVHKECLVYDVTLEEPHLLFITEKEILAHNAIPVVVLPIAVKTIPVVVKVACVAAGAIGLYKLLGGKSKKNNSSHQQSQPDNDPEKEPDNGPRNKVNQRIINTIGKSEFFNKVRDRYYHLKNGIYRAKCKQDRLANGKAEYLEWDYLHSDIEAYSNSKDHLGSINPNTLELYKGPAKIPRRLKL